MGYKYCVDNNVDFEGNPISNVRYGFIVMDSSATITLDEYYEYYLSDGTHYKAKNVPNPGQNTFIHTWNRSKDKGCWKGYRTRAVIICNNDRNVIIDNTIVPLVIDSLYIYLGDCEITKLICGNFSAESSATVLEAIECSNLTTWNSVEDNAFAECSGLQSIKLPTGLLSIGMTAFRGCYSLKNIVLPNSLTSIDMLAFSESHVQSITLPDGLLSIGDDAFRNCFSLKKIVFPNSLVSIGNSAFDSCYSLKDIVLPINVNAP